MNRNRGSIGKPGIGKVESGVHCLITKIFRLIDHKKAEFIDRLTRAVEIPSISADEKFRKDVFRMIDWTQKVYHPIPVKFTYLQHGPLFQELEALGTKCELIPNGKQVLQNGNELDLPPVLFGTLGNDKSKKTLLVYGHLDVQPADKSDGWNTDPFKLVEVDGKLFGRGSTDDKGPVMGWINAIQVMQELKVDIPVNVKFVFEGMEESGSEGLDDILKAHKDTFLADVDFTCISDNYWLGKTKPCITYGLRYALCILRF